MATIRPGAARGTRNIPAQIFISHASEDATLALRLKDLLDGSFPSGTDRGRVSVFCTSDIRVVEGGRAWFDEIMTALRKAQVCITVLTPASVRRRWVMFESGGAFTLSWGCQKVRMLPASAGGPRRGSLPAPFDMITSRDLRTRSGVRQLCREVAGVFNARFQPPAKVVAAICSEARKGSPHWSTVSEVLAGQRLDESPFSLDALLNKSANHIFCAGQNLNYLASCISMRRRLSTWLRKGPGRKLQLLICDPAEDGAVDAWTVVGHKYRDDLHQSIRVFQSWKAQLRSAGIAGRLDIRVTKLVTMTLTVVDPSADTGLMILTPVVFGKPISGERPHFALSRTANRSIFNHYWETYREVFRRARNIEDVALPVGA
jgi:hypothetical protein